MYSLVYGALFGNYCWELLCSLEDPRVTFLMPVPQLLIPNLVPRKFTIDITENWADAQGITYCWASISYIQENHFP